MRSRALPWRRAARSTARSKGDPRCASQKLQSCRRKQTSPLRTQDSRAGAGLQNTQTYIAMGLSATAKPSISAIVLDREALWCRTLANVWPGPRRPALAMANKRVGAHGRAGGL